MVVGDRPARTVFAFPRREKNSWETSSSKFLLDKEEKFKCLENSKPVRSCVLGSTSNRSPRVLPSASGNTLRLLFSVLGISNAASDYYLVVPVLARHLC